MAIEWKPYGVCAWKATGVGVIRGHRKHDEPVFYFYPDMKTRPCFFPRSFPSLEAAQKAAEEWARRKEVDRG